MNDLEHIREQLRTEARFSCQFCGTSETDVGGLLTVDHFRPKSKNGSDEIANLLYACPRCNLYKADYWPEKPNDLPLWNPKESDETSHFLLLGDGMLYGITPIGQFTIQRLRLNRPQLREHRQQKYRQEKHAQLLEQYQTLVPLLRQMLAQQNRLLAEQQRLLQEQALLLRLLLKEREQ